MIVHKSLCDSMSPQVSRTLLSILAKLNIAEIWMVFTCLVYYHYVLLWVVFTAMLADSFFWSDSKSPQVSRTLLNILVDLNSLMLSMYIRWLTFSLDLVSLHAPVHFLSMWFIDIGITNSNGDSAFPWKIPFSIFSSAELLPSAVSSTLHFFRVLSKNLMTSLYILYNLTQSIMQFCRTIMYAFL